MFLHAAIWGKYVVFDSVWNQKAFTLYSTWLDTKQTAIHCNCLSSFIPLGYCSPLPFILVCCIMGRLSDNACHLSCKLASPPPPNTLSVAIRDHFRLLLLNSKASVAFWGFSKSFALIVQRTQCTHGCGPWETWNKTLDFYLADKIDCLIVDDRAESEAQTDVCIMNPHLPDMPFCSETLLAWRFPRTKARWSTVGSGIWEKPWQRQQAQITFLGQAVGVAPG